MGRIRQTRLVKPKTASLMLAFSLGAPLSVWGCEPVLPLAHLLSASTLAGPAFVTHSLLWLIAAVVVKCGAFAVLETGLSRSRAIIFMLLANVISTVPGLFVALFTASPGGILVAIPLVLALGWVVKRRVSQIPQPGLERCISAGSLALAYVGFFVFSLVLFGLADSALNGHRYFQYWLFKFLFVSVVAGTGIIVSAVLEECVIGALARRAAPQRSFYAPVLRANYITLALILLVGALELLPKRLGNLHFLTAWLQSHSLPAPM